MMFWKRHSPKENNTVQQDEKVNELKVALGPLSSEKYCTNSSLRRHLEARNWDIYKSKKMVEETIKWRSTFKPDEIRWKDVAVEGETGKAYRASFHDRHGRTVLILRPGMQNTTGVENQMRHLVYLMENAIHHLPDDQEQMAWLIDFTGWSLNNNVPIKTARETINILQNHYPERLGVAFMYDPPRIFETFWMIVKYFLDPKTSQKVKFVYPKNKDSVELMRTYFDEENLPIEFGGRAKLQYEHEEFSRLMVQDELKAESLQECDKKIEHTSNGYLKTEVARESALVPSAN